jgi:ABC-2 type transport system permease protein
MIGALVFLRVTSFRNWVLWRVRRLRQPKYLIGTIVAVAYFYFVFFRRARGAPSISIRGTRAQAAAMMHALPAEWYPVALAIGAVALAVILAFMWVVPAPRAALGFSEAEIAFLFPAPVTRRSLVHFRLLTAQLRSLMAGLVMAVLSNRWSFLGGNAATHAFGWWFIFSMLNLHFSGASFTLTRLADGGRKVFFRRMAVLGLLAAIVGLTWWRLPPAARLPGENGSGFALVADWIVVVTTAAPLSWLLFPLRLVLAPFAAPDMRTFWFALGPALAVLALHYLWVVRTVVSFEDASIEHAQRRAARTAAWRSGERRFSSAPTRGRPPPFRLGSRGRPELAFLWKNLLSTWPYFTVRVFGWCALAIAAFAAWGRRSPTAVPLVGFAGIAAGIAGAYVLVMGPQFARQDIRSDLNRIDLLKTYPLAGWQIVIGEMLAPAAILTGIVWLTLGAFVLNFGELPGLAAFTLGLRVAGGIALAAVVPPLVCLQLVVPNAAALIFPSWAEATRTRGGGPEIMGQRMIYFAAQLLTMIAVLLPAALVGGVIIAIVQWFAGAAIAIAVATIPVVVVLLGEIALAVWWLGRRFECIDLSAELRN